MKDRREDWLARALVRWVRLALRHGVAVVATALLVCAGAGFYAAHNLGFNVDLKDLFSQELGFQRMNRLFEERFPTLTDSLLVVVEGETPEATRGAAEALAERLATRTDLFRSVYFPGEESFFESHGLLYTDLDELDVFAEDMARLQPVIGKLAREASLASLAKVIRTGLEHFDEGGISPERWQTVLDHFRHATLAVYTESPVSVSWESVLFDGLVFDPTYRRVIVAEPVLEFERVLAAAAPIRAIRDAARALDSEAGAGARVRITGYPALNYEEFLGLARDTAFAGGLSLLLVIAVLFGAFRSLVFVAATAATLISGLIWSAGYAAASVGALNPVSIACAVLFIGLGVDFMIHLGMKVVHELRQGVGVEEAFDRATRSTGSALVLCALTTAIGFLAFLPTDYKGVSELGVICAGSMLIIAFQTLTLFPVLASRWLRGAALERLRGREAWRVPIAAPRWPRLICATAALCGVVGVFFVSDAELEMNVIALRNPQSESVQTFQDLLGSERGTPWYLDMLAPDLPRAQALAREVGELSTVRRAITLADYVPEDQDEKLEVLGDVALFLDLPETVNGNGSLPSAEEQIDALRRLSGFLDGKNGDHGHTGLARSARLLQNELESFLARVNAGGDPTPALGALEHTLLASLPAQLERLRRNLEVSPIDRAALPDGLVRRMLAEDGTARIQVFPAEDLGSREAMVRFVESARSVSADITGLPVNLVESSYATWSSLREAIVWALGAIALVLLVLWRRPADVAITLLPLLLAAELTAAATVAFGVSLNFVNICVLPLLLGIGVDSGVHMMHRARRSDVDGSTLLATTTAQAVLFSALTTLASFGTLALSDHRGIASLGTLLLIGMGLTLLGNLVLLPALIALSRRRSEAAGSRA
ncbi:MAG TPA: MMPL family transporter [Myxococcota bacterium]